MRIVTAITLAGVLAGSACQLLAQPPVKADAVTINASAQPMGTPTVAVKAFRVESADLPGWLGRSIQKSVEEELKQERAVRVVSAAEGATTQPAGAMYEVGGTCRSEKGQIVVLCEVRKTDDGQVVQRFSAAAASTDLLQLKSAVKDVVRSVFAAPPTSGPPAGSPVAPAAAQGAPTSAAPLAPAITAGTDYQGSSLQWAVENPDAFAKDLKEEGKPKGAGVRASPYVYPPGYFIWPGGSVQQQSSSWSGLSISGQYQSKNLSVNFGFGAGQSSQSGSQTVQGK